MTTTGIRKIAMPIRAIEQFKDHAWADHKSASLVIREILEDYHENPAAYRALPDMEGSLSGTITAYVPDTLWFNARDTAYVQGRTPISVIIRKGIRARLEAQAKKTA